MLHNCLEILAELATACGTRAVGAKADYALALLLDFEILLAKITELGVCILPVSHPFGATRLEVALRILELQPFLLELERYFLFLGGRLLDDGESRAKAVELFAKRLLSLDESLSSSFFPIHLIENRELIAQLGQRLE
jgi:hypothetical protein